MYIVSEDVEKLGKQMPYMNNITVPSSAFFKDLTHDLIGSIRNSLDCEVEVVPSQEIEEGLTEGLSRVGGFVVSLDRIYTPASMVDAYIDTTRAVDEEFRSLGSRPRPGSQNLEDQINVITSQVREGIVLVDDVIFSGKVIAELVREFRQRGVEVTDVIAGIGIAEGIDVIESEDVRVSCVRKYDSIIDEVCERDFMAGIPMSGRTVIDGSGEWWSAPYFAPFGDPVDWASIPEGASLEFSRSCVERSIEFWRNCRTIGGDQVVLRDIPRPFIPVNGCGNERIIDVLKQGISIKEGVYHGGE